MSNTRPPFVRIEEAASYSGLSVTWWRQRVWKKEVPFHKVGSRVLIKIADIDALIESGRIDPGPAHTKREENM